MKDRIVAIVSEVAELEDDVLNIPNLLSGGYLDSFTTLMLINSLEIEFGITFEFDDSLIENLDSVARIEDVIKRHLMANHEVG